jgi:hypothetical protein
MTVPFSILNVGWGESAPIAALILSIHYATMVDASPWLLSIMLIAFLSVHWFMHSVVGCGGGTWRSLLRSLCALTLYMSVSVRVTNKTNFAMATILVSAIICSLDSIQCTQSKTKSKKWSWSCILCGLINWGAIISLLTASSSPSLSLDKTSSSTAYSFFYKMQQPHSANHNNNNNSVHLWNWACLVFSVDLLTGPLQDMSVRKGLIWQLICSICLPIIVLLFQNSGKTKGAVAESLACLLIFPSILLAQRKLCWHWIIPLIVGDVVDVVDGDGNSGCNGDDDCNYYASSDDDEGDGIRVIYSVACCCALALCLVVYKPLEITLLFIHFSLHWLAHICRGLALLLLPHGGQK